MILIDRWNTHVARALKDPLLTPQRLHSLRMDGLLFMAREEGEILGTVCLFPLGDNMSVVHGLWIDDSDPDEQRSVGQPLVDGIITRANEFGRAALIPPKVMPFVKRPVLTCKEADVNFEQLRRLMDEARVPRNHELRNVTYKIVGREPQMTASMPRAATTHTEL